eukprot:scaffold2351_cov403-Prasinococcus_capsulatus_cf.AAC.8
MQLDVGSEESIAAFAERLPTVVDKVDILVNNAGIGEANDPLMEVSGAFLKDCFAVNTVGPTLLIQKLVPLMKNSSVFKTIVNVNSDLGEGIVRAHCSLGAGVF